MAFARTRFTNSCTKLAPPAIAGHLQVQFTALGKSATTPALGLAFRWEGSRVEDLNDPFAGILYRVVLQVLQSSSPRPGGVWSQGSRGGGRHHERATPS